MLTPEQTYELVLYCKIGVACLVWLTFVVTIRWLQERRQKQVQPPVIGSDDA